MNAEKPTEAHSTTDHAISAIRLLATASIVACHFLQYYGNDLAYWFNVGVQIFLIISGFLYGQKKLGDRMVWFFKNVKKILSPYYLYLLLILPIYFLFAKPFLHLGDIVHLVTMSSTIQGLGHLWYLPYILLCYFLTPFLHDLWDHCCAKGKSLFRKIIVLGVAAVLLQLIVHFFVPFFTAYHLFCYFVGFWLGKLYLEYGLTLFRKCAVLFVPAGILLSGIQIYFDATPGLISQTLVPIYRFAKGYIRVIFAVSLFLALYLALHALISNQRLERLLQWSNRYSYDVYLVHQFYILGPIDFLAVTKLGMANGLLVLALIVVSAVLLYWLEHFAGAVWKKGKNAIKNICSGGGGN